MFLLLTFIIVNDNTCTKVTSKMLSSNTKAVRHTCNCIVQSLENLFGCSCKGEGLHKLLHYVVKYKHWNVGTFEGLFKSSTFVYALGQNH